MSQTEKAIDREEARVSWCVARNAGEGTDADSDGHYHESELSSEIGLARCHSLCVSPRVQEGCVIADPAKQGSCGSTKAQLATAHARLKPDRESIVITMRPGLMVRDEAEVGSHSQWRAKASSKERAQARRLGRGSLAPC